MGKHTEKLSQSALTRPVAGPVTRAALARTRTVQRAAIISPPAAAAYRGPGYLTVKAVGGFVPKLTQKAFEKYGFSTATLLTDWSRIVGAELGRDTRPERLKWPRTASENADEGAGQAGATLVLRTDPARALDVSYKERQIIERINTYFGYRAIASLKIVQAPVDAFAVAAEPLQAPEQSERHENCAASGDPLSQALARLEARVLNHKPSQPPAGRR